MLNKLKKLVFASTLKPAVYIFAEMAEISHNRTPITLIVT